MATTSFHLKACDISASELHNIKEKDLDCVRKDLSHIKESFSYIDHSLNAELAKINKDVKEKTGRKLQKNAVAIKEGVAVSATHTTMQHLKERCSRCEERFGIKPLQIQIHIHRDVGHRQAKDWKPNLHTHIVWGLYNDLSYNVHISNIYCLQIHMADCFGRERGKQSNKKHLGAQQYKVEQLEQQLEEQSSELKEVKKKSVQGPEAPMTALKSKTYGKRENAQRKPRDAQKRLKRPQTRLLKSQR